MHMCACSLFFDVGHRASKREFFTKACLHLGAANNFLRFFFCTREKYGILNKEHLAEGKPKSINRRRLSTKIKMPEGFAINKDA